MITAKEAAELISPYTGLCIDNEDQRDDIFLLLSLIQSKVWKKGIFKGMVKDFNVNVRKRSINGKDRSFIVTPHGFDILLGINLDGKPAAIRDTYFQFNPSGRGSITNCVSCNWTEDVIDLGDSPTLFQPCENSCSCGKLDCDNRNIGVIEYDCGKICTDDDYPSLTITGYNEMGNRVYTFKPTDPFNQSHNDCRCVPATSTSAGGREVMNGDVYPIKDKLVVHENIFWSKIESIKKQQTNNPVEVFSVCGTTTELLARLEPFQSSSNYRIYELPDCCASYECVHGLFKIAKPERITNESQLLIVDDEEALISLAMSFDKTYKKEEIEKGELYLQKGINTLDEEHKMNRSKAIVPIIVIGAEDDTSFDWN